MPDCWCKGFKSRISWALKNQEKSTQITEDKNVCTITIETSFQVDVTLEELDTRLSWIVVIFVPCLLHIWKYFTICFLFKKKKNAPSCLCAAVRT